MKSLFTTQPWHDDKLLQDLYELRDKQRTDGVKDKKITDKARKIRDEYYKVEAEKINQLAINRQLGKLFSNSHRLERRLC